MPVISNSANSDYSPSQTLPFCCTLSRQSCPQSYLSSFRYWAYISSTPSRNSGRLSVVLGEYPGLLQPGIDIILTEGVRHLSGPRFLISPLSHVAQLIRRALPPPLRYVIRENSWMIKSAYRGRDVPPAQGVIIQTTVSRRFRNCWTGCHCYGESIAHHIRRDESSGP